MRRYILSVVMAALAVVTIGLPAAPALARSNRVVVNAGDSFASGEGGTETGPYMPGSDTPTDQCHRSTSSAVALLNLLLPATLNNVACSGATTDNITTTGQYGEPPQASQISPTTSTVYLMIGGNDVGFGTLAGCFIQTDCDQTPIPALTSQAISVLGPKLDAAYNAIHAAAPTAKVVVTLYPRLLPDSAATAGPNCPELNAAEITEGNQIQTALNTTIANRAQAHHFAVVDPGLFVKGHDVCSTDPYFYRPGTVPQAATYHPNLKGRAAMMSALLLTL